MSAQSRKRETEQHFPRLQSKITEMKEPGAGEEGPQAEAKCLGHYQLVRELGRGGMGVVWKGWDRKLNRWVAVKLLK